MANLRSLGPKLRVLTMDGGSSPLLQVRLLGEIERRVPGFLARTDLFAGASDGAFMTLRLAAGLARGEEPAKAIEGAVALSTRILEALHATPCGFVRLVTGLFAMDRPSKLRDVLRDPAALGELRMGDLDRAMLVVSYDAFSWEPRLYRNFPPFVGLRSPDERDPTLVSTAMSSSAFPIYLPIHFGPGGRHHLDGGLVANNPAMCALGSALHYLQARDPSQTRPMLRDWLGDVSVLSLGGHECRAERRATERPLPLVDDKSAGPTPIASTPRRRLFKPPPHDIDWGWLEWLVLRPLFLIDLLLQGSVGVVSRQCEDLLAEQFHRFEPDMREIGLALRATLTPPAATARALDARAQEIIARGELDATVAWVEANWMKGGADV